MAFNPDFVTFVLFAIPWVVFGWLAMISLGVWKWFHYQRISRGDIAAGFFLGFVGPILIIFVVAHFIIELDWNETVFHRGRN